MKSVLVSGYDLADIHGVVVVIAVPLVLHFLRHIVRCDVGHTALAADEYQLGLLEGRLTLYEYRRQAALVHLIHVTAGLGAEGIQCLTVAVLEHGQGEVLACVYKLLGEAALAKNFRMERFTEAWKRIPPLYGPIALLN